MSATSGLLAMQVLYCLLAINSASLYLAFSAPVLQGSCTVEGHTLLITEFMDGGELPRRRTVRKSPAESQ